MAVCALGCYQLERLLPALTQVLPLRRGPLSLLAGPPSAPSTPAKDVSPPVYLLERIFSPVCQREKYSVRHHHLYRLRPARRQRRPVPPYSLLSSPSSALRAFTWAVAGGLLQSFLRRHTRAFNGAMAAVLALCALDLLF